MAHQAHGGATIMIVSSPRLLQWSLAGAVSLALLPFEARPAYAADPSPAAAAEALADQAYREQAAGKYAEAIGTYVRAYELSGAGAILFNVATIYDRKLHERRLAMEYFRRYLQAPDSESAFVQKATERLSVLKAEVDEEDRARRALPTAVPAPTSQTGSTSSPPPIAPASPAPRETPPPPGWTGWNTAGVVVGAVGLAGIGGSMILGMLTKNKNADANEFCSSNACSDPRGVTLEHQASSLGAAATGVFIGGAALLVTGVTIYLLAPKLSGSPSSSMAITTQVHPSFAGVKVGLAF